jgi:vancomycin resistance protein VanW
MNIVKIIPLLLMIGCTNTDHKTISDKPEIMVLENIQKETPKFKIEEPKILAAYSTQFKEDQNRTHNIIMAATALDGTIIKPKEIFSFNQSVGPRTLNSGYKTAIQFFDGEKVPGVGGGVCQVSSTLYMVARKGGLDVIARQAHSRPVNYTPQGTDATVYYGQLDLELKNPYDVPITIGAQVIGDRISITMLGIEPEFEMEHVYRAHKAMEFDVREVRKPGIEKRIRHQKGRKGYPGESIFIYKKNGNEVKRRIAIDAYKPVPEIWYIPEIEVPEEYQ